jgi:hypothetical protein
VITVRMIITIALSLFTYDLFVRATFIGWVLNGRRRDRIIAPLVLSGIRHLWNGKPWRSLKLRAAR